MKVIYGDMSFSEMEFLYGAKPVHVLDSEFGDTALSRKIDLVAEIFCSDSGGGAVFVNNIWVLTDFILAVSELGGAEYLINLYEFASDKSLRKMSKVDKLLKVLRS